MTYAQPCITNVLKGIPDCVWPDGDPRTATRGEVCERCYEQIDHAITVADHLRALSGTLHDAAQQSGQIITYKVDGERVRSISWSLDGDGYARAITAGGTAGSFAGPRVPLTSLQIALDGIDRAQNGHTDPTTWVQTEAGAAQAVHFADLVRKADRAHPTTEAEHKLHRLRCPECKRQTATWQPPTWPGDDVKITCLSCKWTATHPDAYTIATDIEAKGKLDDADILMLALIAEKRAKRKRIAA